MRELFRKFSRATSDAVGSPYGFIAMLLIVVVWAVSGPVFHFSDTWQLLINTGTTIVTALMVFLIQNTQNRDSKAIHLKLDELLRAVDSARTPLVSLEERSDDDLAQLAEEFRQLGEEEGPLTADDLALATTNAAQAPRTNNQGEGTPVQANGTQLADADAGPDAAAR